MLDWPMPAPLKKVTVNIPGPLLDRARTITGRGITETIVEGLLELDRQRKRSALRGLRGRVRFELDLEKTRR
jgi:hypothetical protein